MSGDYHLRFYNPAGEIVAHVADFLRLSYGRKLNAPGALIFELPADHAAIPLLEDGGQVEVWRRAREYAIEWYCDFQGLVELEDGWRWEMRQGEVYRAICPEQSSLLNWRIVAYPPDAAGRATFDAQPAETIMKALVRYNLTSAGTVADGRLRDAALTGRTILIESDQARGATIAWDSAWDTVLDALQSIAKAGELDFDLVKVGAATWEFRVWERRGEDRQGSVIFSLPRGNMGAPVLTRNGAERRSVAIVGGEDENEERITVVRTAGDFGPQNDREVWVDGRTGDEEPSLEAQGDAALDDGALRRTLRFRALQTPATVYGPAGLDTPTGARCYALGDLVDTLYREAEPHRIVATQVTAEAGSATIETIDITTESYPPPPPEPPPVLDVFFLLDYSGSMGFIYDEATNQTRMAATIQAVHLCLDEIEAWNNGTRVGLAIFKQRVDGVALGIIYCTLYDYEDWSGYIRQTLDALDSPSYGTPMATGLQNVYAQLDEEVRPEAVPLVVLVGDGEPSIDLSGGYCGYDPVIVAGINLRDAQGEWLTAAAVRQIGPPRECGQGAPVNHGVVLAQIMEIADATPYQTMTVLVNEDFATVQIMEYVADVTGGTYFNAPDPEALAAALLEALESAGG